MRTRQDFSEEIVRRIVAIIEAPETLRDDLVGEVYAEERAKAEKEIERLRGCTCDVFDISEGGGHDPRACGEHGYPAGVRDGREESAKELTAAKERIAQLEIALTTIATCMPAGVNHYEGDVARRALAKGAK